MYIVTTGSTVYMVNALASANDHIGAGGLSQVVKVFMFVFLQQVYNWNIDPRFTES